MIDYYRETECVYPGSGTAPPPGRKAARSCLSGQTISNVRVRCSRGPKTARVRYQAHKRRGCLGRAGIPRHRNLTLVSKNHCCRPHGLCFRGNRGQCSKVASHHSLLSRKPPGPSKHRRQYRVFLLCRQRLQCLSRIAHPGNGAPA